MNCYIICLTKIESSLTTALELQKSLEQININSTLFEGTYGNDACVNFQKNNRILYTNKGIKEKKLPGIMGCFDSHYRLWELCSNLNEPIIIFEDDCIILRPLVYVNFQDVLIIASSHYKKMIKYKHCLENPIGIPHAEKYDHISMPGCAGYILKPHAATKLVSFYKNYYLPADNAINTNLVNIEIHSHMIGKAIDHKKNISLIKTTYWEKNVI